MSQKIILDINPDGSVKIEAKGFTGKSCVDATRALEQALGVAGPRKLKPEYRQQAGVQVEGGTG